MSPIRKIRSFIAKKKRVTLFIAAGAAIVLGFIFFRGGDGAMQTLVVHTGDFKQQVSVAGTVKAAQEVDLGFEQGGRVSAVYASVGQRVAAGATLAMLSNADIAATVALKEAALESQQAKLDGLRTGTRPEQIAIAESTVASDEASLVQAQQALVDAIKSAYTTAESAVHNSLDAILRNPNTVNPQLIFYVSDSQYETKLSSGRSSIGAMLVQWQSDLAALSPSTVGSQAPGAQVYLSAVADLLSTGNGALNHAIVSQNTTQADIDAWIADVASARGALNTAISNLTSAQTAYKTAATTLDKDRRNLILERAGATSEDIAAQVAQVAVAKADLANARAQLSKTIIRAPFTGIVTKMDAKVGESVAANIPEVSMISSGVFQIECYVPEVDIASVQVGNVATTTLDAYGGNVFFGASVVTIDPAETITNGVSTYKTVLQFLQPDSRIRPGMTANVIITTADIPNTIGIPRGAIFEKDGISYVQIKEGKEISDRAVTLGASSRLGNVEILSGLSDGDEIVLNPDSAL